MQKHTNIFVSIMLFIAVAFSCIGYAQVSDDFMITGTASAEAVVVIDYLYVSDAVIVDPVSGDTVGTTGGSQDPASPKGWVMLDLDFTASQTKTIKLSVTNANPTVSYSFYQPQCVDAYTSTGTTYTVAVTSGITCGTLNSQGLVVGGTNIIPGGGTINNIYLTITSSKATKASVILQMIFGFKGEADKQEAENQATVKNALERFRIALNTPVMYDAIITEMRSNGTLGIGGNYVGNVVGSGGSDTELIENIFGDTLQKVSFSEGGVERTCTVMIKKKDVTSKCSGDEMVLLITTEDPTEAKKSSLFSKGGLIQVFAIVFAYDSANSQWNQYGDMYSGDANVNAYNFPNYGNDSFDTETWRVLNNQTYTVTVEGREVKYTVYDNNDISTAIEYYESAVGK